MKKKKEKKKFRKTILNDEIICSKGRWEERLQLDLGESRRKREREMRWRKNEILDTFRIAIL
jgi:hypothetical protein